MNVRLKMILILTLFACISGGVLSVVYIVSNPLIEANMLAEQDRSIFLVVPEAKSYEEVTKSGFTYYECKDQGGGTVGIAMPAKGNGYQGTIRLMVGLSPDLETITGLAVLEQVETPGLGGRISEEGFSGQFKGIHTDPAVGWVKNQAPEKDTDIQAVTGATISSRSVVAIINKNIGELKKVL
ncbi:MAG: FMN-binding protein [Spirochaetes bacterium]|nr:FMN-binding protein [Spirochaetota bacterium]